MERVYKDKKKCCGCEACSNICPVQAITMQPDEYGFIYPVINSNLCIDCGLCQKACAFQNIPVYSDEPVSVYAATNKNKEIILNSTSGGVFGALASIVFEQNGVVYGCSWNSKMEPEHICINKYSDMKKLQGSKYVQSSMQDVYIEVRHQLLEGVIVLFTGTPCQVAALKSFLGKNYDNLISADIICHGVPSQAFFKDYIKYLEDKLNGEITDFNFRDKSNGWSLLAKVTYKKQTKTRTKKIPNSASFYYSYFLKGHIYRESCYECKYAGGTRQGDFTMGDYWGVENNHPNIKTKNGVSALLINSKKGVALLYKIEEYLELTLSTYDQVRNNNGQLNQPTPISQSRDEILNLWLEGGAHLLGERFRINPKEQVANIFRTYLPYNLKDKLKRLKNKL